jgi:hypothetical protein
MAASDCIKKLVVAGRISRALGDEALALYRRSLGEYTEIMGPASAEAAAALSMARALEAGALKMANDQAKQAGAWARFEKRMLEHPKGRVAGIMSQLTRDIWEFGGENVHAKTEVIWARLSQKFEAGLDALRPGVLGQSAEQLDTFRQFVLEVFGVDSRNATAKTMAAGWKQATDESVRRMLDAGHRFEPNEDWRIWQFWNPLRVRRFERDEFKRDILEEVQRGALTLWDRDTGKPAAAARHDFILNRAYRDITANDNAPSAFSREVRTFQFAEGQPGADAWLKFQGKYGAGENVIGMTAGHLYRAAREIALAEVIGPNHEAIISAALRQAREEQQTGVQRFLKFLESPAMIQRTYDVLTGKADQVEGPMIAGVLGGLRSINTASKLGGAIISAIPGDSVTATLAAAYNGMPVGRLIDGVVRELARGGEESRALAARINLTGHSAMEYAHGYRYFQDQVAGPELFRAVATATVRLQGLQAWTELIKRIFTMEFMGHLADHAGHDLAALGTANPALARFLTRHGLADQWDAIRAGAPLEVGRATFLDPETIADVGLREKLIGAIVDERAYAVLEPDARVRAISTQGLPAGSFMGEVSRNLFLFKSFSLSMATTHLMRVATQGPIESRLYQGAAFTVLSLVAGALTMQAKNVVFGKDPEAMNKIDFWAKAAIQGGGLGVYGDLVNSAFTRTGRHPLVELAGPVAQVGEDVSRLTSKQIRRMYEGEDTTLGAEAVRTVRRMTPNTFYTRLAVDRLIYDQLQTRVDADYRKSFRRMEQRLKQDTGQRYWFGPGRTTPERAPDLGAALPSR